MIDNWFLYVNSCFSFFFFNLKCCFELFGYCCCCVIYHYTHTVISIHSFIDLFIFFPHHIWSTHRTKINSFFFIEKSILAKRKKNQSIKYHHDTKKPSIIIIIIMSCHYYLVVDEKKDIRWVMNCNEEKKMKMKIFWHFLF